MLIPMKYPHHLKLLMEQLKKLPGVGARTAERFSFEMLSWSENDLLNLSALVLHLKNKVLFCQECGCLIDEGACRFCSLERMQEKKLCITSSFKSVIAIDSTGLFKGMYHVLTHLISPLKGLGPDTLKVDQLKERIKRMNIQEIVLALDSTLEGDATALYLKRELAVTEASILRLATGIPMGSSLDLIDPATLSRALIGRNLI